MVAIASAPPRTLPRWITPAMLFAGACIVFGVLWDISWHMTIGRDTFWTPAHLLIHLGGVTGGSLAGWLAFDATVLRRSAWRSSSVGVLFARAPLGAWVAIWGACAMLVSAPFDNWWHDAYGLDVKILSPPHTLLALGMFGVSTGALFLAAGERNRLGNARSTRYVIVAKGLQVALAGILLLELSMPNAQHTGTFLLASCVLYPAALVSAAWEPRTRFPAVKVALVFMLANLAMTWILPLFPAEPKLAPIFNRVDHMTPLPFPLLLFAPAVAIDLWFHFLRRRAGATWSAARVFGSAVLFVAVFLPVQWEFSRFMITPGADNRFFAGHGRYFSYTDQKGRWVEQFWRLKDDPIRPATVGWALLVATGAAMLGDQAGRYSNRLLR